MNITTYGRIAKNPELKSYTTADGATGFLANFTIAVANRYGAKTKASFINCVVFGNRAVALAKHFAKGSEIVVHGYFEQEEYDKDGQKARAWKLTVSEFEFCGKKADSAPVEVAVDDVVPEGFDEVK